MNISVKQLTLLVSDMQRSIQFYRDVLGLTSISLSEHWREFEAGSVQLALHPGQASQHTAQSGTDVGTLNIVLQVPDLGQACQYLRDQAVAVDGPHTLEGWPPLATFSDPDGISFTLTGG